MRGGGSKMRWLSLRVALVTEQLPVRTKDSILSLIALVY